MELGCSRKMLCILVYASLVLLVPPTPSIYTFSINCIGFVVTMAASFFTIYFLNITPLPLKNLLNRILILIIAALILGTTRDVLCNLFLDFSTEGYSRSIPSPCCSPILQILHSSRNLSSKLFVCWETATVYKSCCFP